MEYSNIVDEIENADMKIQSVLVVKKSSIEPVERILAEADSPADFSLRRMEELRLYLELNRNQLYSLSKAVVNNRCANSDIEKEVQETIDILKKIIPQVEEKIEIYKQSLEDKNKKIDTSYLKKYCHDPKLFESLIKEILVVYEEPLNNVRYGEIIRNVLIDLKKFESSKDFQKLHQHIKHCESLIQEVEKRQGYLSLQTSKDDLVKVHKSLVSLLEVCSILSSNTKEENE